ncbi:coenzyme F420-0:L-glutamate ligase [Gammaproteobacteria bacterium]|jgi:coenzyme F420-0:L-glutamate ligase/coenzyme F420-1:gamma-L-glutamate ligase|nr:coenzyme F420-0:L-glutamate ligase [Gammaproteobacteria bacterium]MDB2482405.1 coenzyme F420-0:L-glutamate ligase [Gammaproteobacteria bacterium]
MDHLKLIALKDFPLVQPNDNLASLILKSLKLNSVDLEDGDVIVIAQKIVSKSENRYKNIDEVVASKEAEELAKKLNREPGFIQIILDESSKILSTEKNVIIVEHKLGFININAGLDRSNIEQDNNIVLLLPDNPSASAINLQESISRKSNQSISLIISDSMTRPYRSGVTNFALASSNLQSLIDLKGELDIYGNTLKSTEIAIADELSAAAGILMGQGDDGQPVIIIKGFNRDQYSKNDAFNLIVNEEDDLYR